MRQALARAGIEVTALHQVSDPATAVADAQALFVGGGNSFRLLRALTTLGVLEAEHCLPSASGNPPRRRPDA